MSSMATKTNLDLRQPMGLVARAPIHHFGGMSEKPNQLKSLKNKINWKGKKHSMKGDPNPQVQGDIHTCAPS